MPGKQLGRLSPIVWVVIFIQPFGILRVSVNWGLVPTIWYQFFHKECLMSIRKFKIRKINF